MTPRLAAGVLAATCFGAVGAALVTQHAFGMQPCPWCILQRVIFVLIGLLALLSLVLGATLRRGLGALMALLALAGVAAALYQHFVAAKSSSCALTLADRIVRTLQVDRWLPAVFEVRGSCADAAVDLAGLPYEFWSLALFVLLALGALGLARGARR